MSIANTLFFERLGGMTQQTTYIGESESPFQYVSWGSLPSDDGFGLFLDKKCTLKKLVYYNLGTSQDFVMTLVLKNYDKNTILKTFEVSGRTTIQLNIQTEGMIGIELVTSNETDESFARHRFILYAQ